MQCSKRRSMSQAADSSATRRSFVGGVLGAAAAWGAAAQPGPRRAPAKVRIGVVGGGFGSQFQWHLDPGCEVCAVCDLREDALDRLTRAYRCGNRYKSFREFLKHPGMDAVAVFTPLPLHAWMTLESLRNGKHVISAVPAAMTAAELEEMIDTVRSTGLRYMMAETSYYRPEIITCRQWAREGQFGTIFYSEAEYHHEGLIPLMYDAQGTPTWRHGLPPDALPHALHRHGDPGHRRTPDGSQRRGLGRSARGHQDERLSQPLLEHDGLASKHRAATVRASPSSGTWRPAARSAASSTATACPM